jgi:PAS domain S-box-containing protein
MTSKDRICKITTLINSIGNPIAIHSASGIISYINDAFCKTIGHSRSGLNNKSLFHIEKKCTLNKFRSSCRALKSNNTLIIDGIHENVKGNRFPVEYTIKCIIINKKKYYVSTIFDLSETVCKEAIALHHLKFVKLAKEIGMSLSSLENIDLKINNILKNLGEFVNVDRSYIFTLNKQSGLFSNSYEWCRPRVKHFKDNLQNINLKKDYPWLARKFKNPSTLVIDDVRKLPKFADSFIAELRREKIFSIVISPILFNDKIIGFIGFDKIEKCIQWQAGDVELLETISGLLANTFIQMEEKNKEHAYKLQLEMTLVKTIAAISKILEERDFYTSNHQFRVAELATAIAKHLKLNPIQIFGIYLGGLIHDIGKIAVPLEILSQPRKLTDQEYAVVCIHPEQGYKIVKEIPFVWPIASIILQHHERINGSGYPRGLKGEQISLEARIVAVADVYESMTSHRPYRPRLTKQAAINELSSNSGKLYDKKVVESCLKVIKNFKFRKFNDKLISMEEIKSLLKIHN